MYRRQRGFSLVEVLLATMLFGFFATALVGAIIYGQQSTVNASNNTRAAMLLDEGVQALASMRGDLFATSSPGDTYGFYQSGGKWTLVMDTPDVTDIFTRSVIVFANNAYTRSMLVEVEWPDGRGGTSNIVEVFRLKNWTSPVILPKLWTNAYQSGSLDLSGTVNGVKVATQGDYAYIVKASGTASLSIVNISNPASPTLVSSLNLSASPTNIAVSGDYAYVTSSSDTTELQVINITNPAAPVITRNYNASGTANATSVKVNGNYAYLLKQSDLLYDELEVLNVSNPVTAITKVAGYSNNTNLNDLTINNGYAYVGTSSTSQEILVFNLANPAAPSYVTAYNISTSGAVNAVEAVNNNLMIAQGTRLVTYNITTPASGVQLSNIVPTGTDTINDLAIDATNQYLFLATNATASEFKVVDMSDPAVPVVVRMVDTTGTDNLMGIAYNATYDIVVGTHTLDTGEVQIFAPNN